MLIERVEELVAVLTNHHIYTSSESQCTYEPTAENQSNMDRDYAQMTELTHTHDSAETQTQCPLLPQLPV